MTSQKSLSGSCACGDIRYTSTAHPSHLDFCYCTTCQRVSGAPFQAWTGIPKASLTWTFASEPFSYCSLIADKGISMAERVNCGKCGCNVILQYVCYPEKTHVAASTIGRSDFEALKVGCHIWTKSCPTWYEIPEDGVERWKEFDPGFQKLLDEFLAEQMSGT